MKLIMLDASEGLAAGRGCGRAAFFSAPFECIDTQRARTPAPLNLARSRPHRQMASPRARAQSPFHLNGELLSIVLDALPLDELVRSSGCRGCSRGWRAATAAAADGRIRRWPVLASLIRLMECSSFTAAEGDDEGASEEDTSRLHFWLSDGVGTRAALLRGTEALLRDAAGEVNISGAQVPWDAISWPLVRLRGVYNGCKGVIQVRAFPRCIFSQAQQAYSALVLSCSGSPCASHVASWPLFATARPAPRARPAQRQLPGKHARDDRHGRLLVRRPRR